MPVDVIRIRSVDDVVVAFFEPERDLPELGVRRLHEAIGLPGIQGMLILSVGPVRSDPEVRRSTIDLLKGRGIRVVAVTNHRLNRGLIGLFGWLGVPITGYPWARLEDAARDVAARPDRIAPVVRAALALRAESPAAVGLAPDEG